jgi:hypothetical protein
VLDYAQNATSQIFQGCRDELGAIFINAAKEISDKTSLPLDQVSLQLTRFSVPIL